MPRTNYRFGVPGTGYRRELLNSDAKIYGGSGNGNFGGLDAMPIQSHGRNRSISLVLPPLGIAFLKNEATLAEAGRLNTEEDDLSSDPG